MRIRSSRGEHPVSSWLFRRVCKRHAVVPVYDDARFLKRFDHDVASTQRFLARFEGRLDFEGRSVLDVGCGRGATCVEVARRGASRVVGVDLGLARQTRAMALDPELASRVEFHETDGSLADIASETFDIVLSKDSFEHYANPESFVFTVLRFITPGGLLVIGCGPLWRSPTGGHLEFMTPMPWAHLLFPEDVIMQERRRFRPVEDARSFEEIRGGLNRMTLARFSAIMRSTALECVFFDTNVGHHPAMRAMKVIAAVPPLRELFTMNVYGIWAKSAVPPIDDQVESFEKVRIRDAAPESDTRVVPVVRSR